MLELSDAERTILREMYAAGVHYSDVVRRMGYPSGIIRRELTALGIRRSRPSTRWTPAEDDILAGNYGARPITEWMHLLPSRTYHAISSRARHIGLMSKLDEKSAMANLELGRRVSPARPPGRRPGRVSDDSSPSLQTATGPAAELN